MAVESVESIVYTLFTLDEPWRGRFLALVADWANPGDGNGGLPGQEEVAAWLDADRALRQQVAYLLGAWLKPGEG